MGGELCDDDYVGIVTRWRDANISKAVVCHFVHVDPYAINMPRTGLVHVLSLNTRAKFVPRALVTPHPQYTITGPLSGRCYFVPVTLSSYAFGITSWFGPVACAIDVVVDRTTYEVIETGSRWSLEDP